jgi:tRNA pseudouridine38-40 synthase
MTQHRYFVLLSFHGKNYHGWQIQPNAHSVQAELDSALAVLTREKVVSVGCGRTDAGVHARIFYAHFDIAKAIVDTDAFCRHLNGILPYDVAVSSVMPVAPETHARFDAISRTYEYHLYSVKNPFLREFAAFFPHPLNYDLMNALASMLMEYEDFSCFSKSNTQVFTNNCKIYSAEWTKRDDRYVFTIRANRFLRNMVRAITGTLILAGEDKLDEAGFRSILEGKDRKAAGVSMPACGLYLTDVEYPAGFRVQELIK